MYSCVGSWTAGDARHGALMKLPTPWHPKGLHGRLVMLAMSDAPPKPSTARTVDSVVGIFKVLRDTLVMGESAASLVVARPESAVAPEPGGGLVWGSPGDELTPSS